jgi:type I restriction enzyme M protein
MRWVAPTEKNTAKQVLKKRLLEAADQFRANSGLKVGQYSTAVLGLTLGRDTPGEVALEPLDP